MKTAFACLFTLVCTTNGFSQIPFQFADPVELPAPVNLQGVLDGIATVTPDGLTMYFNSVRSGWGLYEATRPSVDMDFDDVRRVGDIGHPDLSSDGLTLIGNRSDSELFIATRNSLTEDFSQFRRLEGSVNTRENERWASLSPNGLELYFTRNPSGENPPFDLMVATRTDTASAFGTPTKLPAPFNLTPYYDNFGVLTADGLSMIFSSDRPDGFGGEDLWVSQRESLTSAWGDPLNLGPQVNSSINEWAPNLSADDGTLYFTRYTNFDDAQIWSATLVPEPSTELLSLCAAVIGMMTLRSGRRIELE